MKSIPTRRAVLCASATVALLTLTACGGNVGGATTTEEFPAKPITVTVGHDPGGSTDLIARAMAEGATKELDVAMPVVNKPGANGTLALKELQTKPADGYELAIVNSSLITITPLTAEKGDEVLLEDFDVVTGISQDDFVLVANPEVGIKTLADLKAAKDLTFGTTGVGTGSQLAQALLLKQAKIAGTEIPFGSGAPAVTAALGNQVNLSTVQMGEAKPHIDAGKLIPIVIFANERNNFLPDVPTAKEEGYDIPVSQYRAIVAPKGTPDDVKSRLKDAFESTFETEGYKKFNEQNLLSPKEVSAEEVMKEWTELAKSYKELTAEYDISMKTE